MGLEITWNREDAWVKVGERELPTRFALVFRPGRGRDEPGWMAEFHVRDGIPQCRHIIVSSTENGREVRTSDLRALHVEDLLEGASANVAARRVVDDEGQARMVRDLGDWQTVVKTVRAARRNGRRKVTDEMLREVADVYRANADDDPMNAVAAHFDKAYRTARLYVKHARDRGLL